MNLDRAYEAQSIETFLDHAFPAEFGGVAARILETGAGFSPTVAAWAPRWSGIPFTVRKQKEGGPAEKLATVLYRSHDCLHQLWGLPSIDASRVEDRRAYKRTQMCGEVAVLTLTEFVLAAAWARHDAALAPVLAQRNALPLLQGPLVGLSTREIAARLDGVLHQRLGDPPAWVRENAVATAFVEDYGRMLEEDRRNIERCLGAMIDHDWKPPPGPIFRPMSNMDGLELTLWMVDDFFHLARTSTEMDRDLRLFNQARRAAIYFPPGWAS